MSDKKYESGVVLLSGGLDSAVCLSVANEECANVHPLAFQYGQKTLVREMACAQALAQHCATQALKVVNLDFLGQITGAALCNEDQLVTGANEYVPFRNGLFLAVATAFAETVKASLMYIGSTGGDRICRDNSQAFRDAFEAAIAEGTNTQSRIRIVAPFGDVEKIGVIERGFELGTPFEHTWSCHNNLDEPCDQCSNCQSRKAAFHAIGREDPIRKLRN